MKNKTKKMYVIISLAIFSLLIFSYMYEPPLKNIKNISQKDLNKMVRIRGKATQLKEYTTKTQEKLIIVTLEDTTGSIDIVLFSKSNKITVNQTVTVQGKVSEYNGEFTIIPDKIN